MGKNNGKATIHLTHLYSFFLEKISQCFVSPNRYCIVFPVSSIPI